MAASLNAQEAPLFEDNQATGTEPRGGALFVDTSSAVIASGVLEANKVTVLAGAGYGGASQSRAMRGFVRMGNCTQLGFAMHEQLKDKLLPLLLKGVL
jgi:hypothetical protein